MELVPGFVDLLQPFVSTMTGPTWDSMMTIAYGQKTQPTYNCR